jgi:hypothetical protein
MFQVENCRHFVTFAIPPQKPGIKIRFPVTGEGFHYWNEGISSSDMIKINR